MKGDIFADYWDMIKSVQEITKETKKNAVEKKKKLKTKRNNKYTRKPV